MIQSGKVVELNELSSAHIHIHVINRTYHESNRSGKTIYLDFKHFQVKLINFVTVLCSHSVLRVNELKHPSSFTNPLFHFTS